MSIERSRERQRPRERFNVRNRYGRSRERFRSLYNVRNRRGNRFNRIGRAVRRSQLAYERSARERNAAARMEREYRAKNLVAGETRSRYDRERKVMYQEQYDGKDWVKGGDLYSIDQARADIRKADLQKEEAARANAAKLKRLDEFRNPRMREKYEIERRRQQEDPSYNPNEPQASIQDVRARPEQMRVKFDQDREIRQEQQQYEWRQEDKQLARDKASGKPNPDMVDSLMRTHSLSKEQATYIEEYRLSHKGKRVEFYLDAHGDVIIPRARQGNLIGISVLGHDGRTKAVESLTQEELAAKHPLAITPKQKPGTNLGFKNQNSRVASAQPEQKKTGRVRDFIRSVFKPRQAQQRRVEKITDTAKTKTTGNADSQKSKQPVLDKALDGSLEKREADYLKQKTNNTIPRAEGKSPEVYNAGVEKNNVVREPKVIKPETKLDVTSPSATEWKELQKTLHQLEPATRLQSLETFAKKYAQSPEISEVRNEGFKSVTQLFNSVLKDRVRLIEFKRDGEQLKGREIDDADLNHNDALVLEDEKGETRTLFRVALVDKGYIEKPKESELYNIERKNLRTQLKNQNIVPLQKFTDLCGALSLGAEKDSVQHVMRIIEQCPTIFGDNAISTMKKAKLSTEEKNALLKQLQPKEKTIKTPENPANNDTKIKAFFGNQAEVKDGVVTLKGGVKQRIDAKGPISLPEGIREIRGNLMLSDHEGFSFPQTLKKIDGDLILDYNSTATAPKYLSKGVEITGDIWMENRWNGFSNLKEMVHRYLNNMEAQDVKVGGTIYVLTSVPQGVTVESLKKEFPSYTFDEKKQGQFGKEKKLETPTPKNGDEQIKKNPEEEKFNTLGLEFSYRLAIGGGNEATTIRATEDLVKNIEIVKKVKSNDLKGYLVEIDKQISNSKTSTLGREALNKLKNALSDKNLKKKPNNIIQQSDSKEKIESVSTAQNKSLEKQLGSSLLIMDESQPAVKEHLQQLSLLPNGLVEKLRQKNLKIVLSNRDVIGMSNDPQFRRAPRGWDQPDWKGIPGGYDTKNKILYAGTGRHGSSSLILHEYGHAFGDLLNEDSKPAVKEAHVRLFEKISAYERQAGAGSVGGTEEFFAESFGNYFIRSKEAFIKKYDPQWYTYMDSIIRSAS